MAGGVVDEAAGRDRHRPVEQRVLGLAHPRLQARVELRAQVGERLVLGEVAHLAGVGEQVVELEPRAHSNDTVGIVEQARVVEAARPERRDVTWHPSALDRRHRWRRLGQQGATVWLTGLPASGKSTIAVALERALVESQRSAYLLDGDNLRYGLSDDLGFSPGDRAEHIRRVAHLARLIADSGTVAVVSLVSPMAADRADARALHDAAGLRFVEVHVDTTADECARRDPKGLYARARAGEIQGFTGVDAPYEAPPAPELHVPTAEVDVERAVAAVVELLGR